MRTLLTTCVAAAALLGAAAPAAAQTPGAVVFLVRHAEKADDRGDASLTAEGADRAGRLATLLRDIDLEAVHTTSFRRTRATAAPAAAAAGLEPREYDADELEALAHELLATGGQHLVVGHSNTTHRMVALLGGEAGPPIEEDEYDRLYILIVAPEGYTRTFLMRY